jgi:hypothetical protein
VLDAISKGRSLGKFRFTPFIETLQSSKNIIILEITVQFIHALIEAEIQDSRRVVLRSEFVTTGLLQAFKVDLNMLFLVLTIC